METFLEPRKWSSQVFVRACSHPIVEELSSYDLHLWQPDRSVGTGAYRMLWGNHKPETPVKQIVFSNTEMKSLPVLIGVTAAARRETIPVPAGLAARAKKSFEDGKKAFQDNKLDDACRLLRDAVVSDPSLKEAYLALADATEKKNNEDWIFDAYRIWFISGPRNPLLWNRIGEILEKRKDLRGALNAYKKLLQIEWNQPPTMDAVRRLEAIIK